MQEGYNYDKALGFQQITNVSAATGLTIPVGTASALIQAQTQTVRWRDDGTAPTATVGMTLSVGSTLEYTGTLTAIKFIEVAPSAVLNISYYGA